MNFNIIKREEVLPRYEQLACSDDEKALCDLLGCTKGELKVLVKKLQDERLERLMDPRPSAREVMERKKEKFEALREERRAQGEKIYSGEIISVGEKKKKATVWSAEDTQRLKEMYLSGESCMRIAEVLEVDVTAIYTKVKYLKKLGEIDETAASRARRAARERAAREKIGDPSVVGAEIGGSEERAVEVAKRVSVMNDMPVAYQNASVTEPQQTVGPYDISGDDEGERELAKKVFSETIEPLKALIAAKEQELSESKERLAEKEAENVALKERLGEKEAELEAIVKKLEDVRKEGLRAEYVIQDQLQRNRDLLIRARESEEKLKNILGTLERSEIKAAAKTFARLAEVL